MIRLQLQVDSHTPLLYPHFQRVAVTQPTRPAAPAKNEQGNLASDLSSEL